ncbi:MAG: multidrug transporter [Oscillospiraceae bacterium]|nr:multidrug transporter [Oscillospiraceae bacterium]
MQNNEFTENDRKLFRTRLAKWQEAYYTRLVREYTELLNGDGTPGEKIYELEQRVQNERKHSGVRLPFRMSRSMVIRNLCFLLRNPVTRADDLKDFSDELKEQIQFITETE